MRRTYRSYYVYRWTAAQRRRHAELLGPKGESGEGPHPRRGDVIGHGLTGAEAKKLCAANPGSEWAVDMSVPR